MNDITLVYASWCNQKGHDKVWGYFCIGSRQDLKSNQPMFVFWGKRGKNVQIKQHVYSNDLLDLRYDKQAKGYNQISKEQFYSFYPNFDEDVQDKVVMSILSDDKYKSVDN